MITQNIQKHPHTEVITGFHTSVNHLLYSLIERIDTHRENKSQHELYNYYQKFTIDQLRDIGMGDPEDQLRILGRYLDAETINSCVDDSGSD